MINFIDENSLLKNQMAAMKESANQLEEEHSKQMAEAMEDIQRVHKAHKKEIEEAQENTKQQSEACGYIPVAVIDLTLSCLPCSAASDRDTGEKC